MLGRKRKVIPLDASCEAEYEDGFILNETEQNDISAYVECPLVDGVPTGPNTFDDILKKRPEAEHGPMVRFSVFFNYHQYDINWRDMPDSARPIRFRNKSGDYNEETGEMVNIRLNWLRFGYQYNDALGKNVEEVMELR